MNYYQHNIGDYRRDTMHLSLLEHGIYRQLLDLYYLNECELDANALRLICARTADEMQTAENILNEFFEPTENGWKHKRCDEEIARYKAKSDKAKASADARWSERNAKAMRTHSEGNANHKPITNNHKPIKNKYTPPIGSELLSAWMEVRKAKKAGAVTELAFKGLEREANSAGITPDQAVQVCIERSWVSFKAEWYAKPSLQNKSPPRTSADRQIEMANAMFGDLVNGRRTERELPQARAEGDRSPVLISGDDLR